MIGEAPVVTPNRDPPRSYSVRALAELWGCSPNLIYTLMETGELAFWKLGGKIFRIKRVDADEYERRQQTTVDEVAGIGGVDVLAVAAEWGCSVSFVYGEIKSGSLQAYKLGRKYRITVAAMEAYQCQNLTASANLPVPVPMAPSIGPSPSLGMLSERGASGYPSVRQIKQQQRLSLGTFGHSTR